MNNDWCYDIETYPNIFTFSALHIESGLEVMYEVSDWVNQSAQMVEFIHMLNRIGGRMVGYNNLGFDYPVVHMIVRMGRCDAKTIYDKAMSIIQSQGFDEGNERFMHSVKPTDRAAEQIDLYKTHHFDNKAKATSLKMLEFNMGAQSIEDLPFPVGTSLTKDQIPVLKKYNRHDVHQTAAFYKHTLPMLKFREELCQKYPGKDWLNFNDTKIGKEFFIMKLEEGGVQCYDFGPNGRQPRQTKRPQIALKDAILPWLKFQQPEFTRILEWLKSQIITETKGVFEDVTAVVNGFTFVFGLGGIHGSVESEVIESDEDHVIVDLDVASYYPNLAIANGFYPYHLGQSFCTIYKSLYDMRKTYDKKSAENAMLKLALNGTYGDSNNKFSVFYDPLFTMCITLNGQLQLCLLAETLMAHVPDLKMIQVNTDGMTVRIPRVHKDRLDAVRGWWEGVTKLQLEEAIYKSMHIRDVNSYIAVYEKDGSVKRKGAYEWKKVEDGGTLGWHQNRGALVVPRVAEMVLLKGVGIRETIESWPDIMDFMLRTKVPRSSKLMWGDQQVQNITRYVIAKNGKQLTKVMPPLAKDPTKWRNIGIESGWNVAICNDLSKMGDVQIDYEYYVRECEKLTMGLS